MGQIWGLQRQRPLPQRVLLYWSAITLGPLFLGASLAITSYLVTASRDVVDVLPGSIRWLLDSFEFVLLTACVSGLYFYVPYTRVRWRHAITAGFLVAGALELAKKAMAIYLLQVPTYSLIDLLFQVMLDWGVDLALPIARETIQGKEVFFVDGNALAACFDASGGVDEDFVKSLAKHQPMRVVFRDAGFKDSAVKIDRSTPALPPPPKPLPWAWSALWSCLHCKAP